MKLEKLVGSERCVGHKGVVTLVCAGVMATIQNVLQRPLPMPMEHGGSLQLPYRVTKFTKSLPKYTIPDPLYRRHILLIHNSRLITLL